MPNIVGTNGNDNIDVSNDTGTLNGAPQGTPIDNVRGRQGDDTIDVTNSTITGNVVGNAGADTITVTNSTIGGRLAGGSSADTINVSGSSVRTISMGSGNDTLNFSSTSVTEDIRGGNGVDTLNLPVGTVITDATFGTITVEDGVGYSLSSGTFTLPSGLTVTYTTFENGSGVPCFTRDTRILSQNGLSRIQTLRVGDLIPTLGQGPQPIRWIGRRHFDKSALLANPRLLPVRILAGALGEGLPHRDLLVSRQHRMLVQSRIAERMFGAAEVLIPAIKLIALPGVFIDEQVESVEYFHLLFDRHEIIFAEDAPTESLFTGPEALKSLGAEAQQEIFDIFPELVNRPHAADLARHVPKGRQQVQLIARHVKNNKPVLQAV
ncbi:Hint domain-containing protein [Rhodobacteraceae bacterium B1Z28]|uniref:Hint domain-containing protein n=1 Tax=Ruegeria haliotis TaxID=2747601 RepID=A0ABX2PUL8_9RHOB|nr:Hint domain-containing protein [Ruegeria haliotis]NVO57247.1 Hint domain-containing protein [Ruegeria haliotis]